MMSAPVGATTVVELSDEQFVSMSSEIVYGRIISVQPFQYTGQVILTRVEIEVETWLKPASNEEKVFVFYTRGGSVDQITQSVAGEMVPKIGDEVVVFLERIPRYQNLPMLLGLKQGVFYAESLSDGSPKSLRRRLSDLDVVPGCGDARHCTFKQARTLDDLIGRIKLKLAEETNP